MYCLQIVFRRLIPGSIFENGHGRHIEQSLEIEVENYIIAYNA